MRANMPRFDKENFDKNLALVEEVRHLAAQKQCTPGQLALAWVLAQVRYCCLCCTSLWTMSGA